MIRLRDVVVAMMALVFSAILFAGGKPIKAAAQAAKQEVKELSGRPDPAKPDGEPRRYIKTPTGFLLVLRQGDKVFPKLEAFLADEKISAATFSGMGFVNAKFGYFDFTKKKYDPVKEFKGVELASFTGSLAWQDNKPSVHAHGVVTNKYFQAFGGHMLEAEVSTGSLEIAVTVLEKKLERKMEPAIGANVLSLE